MHNTHDRTRKYANLEPETGGRGAVTTLFLGPVPHYLGMDGAAHTVY